MMMMMKLAEATANVDVYIVASNNTGAGRRRSRRRRHGRPRRTPRHDGSSAARRRAAASAEARRSGTSTMANLACYPAINVPNGFSDTGIADQRDLLRAAVRRDGAARAGEGVPGCGRLSPEAADRARHVSHQRRDRLSVERRSGSQSA